MSNQMLQVKQLSLQGYFRHQNKNLNPMKNMWTEGKNINFDV